MMLHFLWLFTNKLKKLICNKYSNKNEFRRNSLFFSTYMNEKQKQQQTNKNEQLYVDVSSKTTTNKTSPTIKKKARRSSYVSFNDILSDEEHIMKKQLIILLGIQIGMIP